MKLLLFFIPLIAHAQYFTDTFSSAINTSSWAANSSDSAFVSNGFLNLVDGGQLVSTSTYSSLDITTKFRFAATTPYDYFRIMVRTDGVNGMSFIVRQQDDAQNKNGNITIEKQKPNVVSSILTRATYTILPNIDYVIRMVDDGTNLSLYLGDLTRPIIVAKDTYSAGSSFAISNRPINTSKIVGDTWVALSSFSISLPQASHISGHSITATVGSGSSALNDTLVIDGATNRSFLIRASGPALKTSGALTNVAIAIYQGSSLIAQNFAWSSTTTNSAGVNLATSTLGLPSFAQASGDSAMVLTLPPSIYTVQMYNPHSGTGVGMLEVYEIK